MDEKEDDNKRPGKLSQYRVTVGNAETYCRNGIELDRVVMDVLSRGVTKKGIEIAVVNLLLTN